MNKKLRLIIAISSIVLIASLSIYLLVTKMPKKEVKDDKSYTKVENYIVEKSPFKLTAEYEENSKWKYTVTSQLPNPCTDVSVSHEVTGKNPMKVSVNVTSKEKKDKACTQMILNYKSEGSVEADRTSSFVLMVNGK